jgi:thiamine monophosphate synthase
MLRVCILDYSTANFSAQFVIDKFTNYENAPDFVILRERVDFATYRAHFEELQPILGDKLIIHSRAELADELSTPLHLPFEQAAQTLVQAQNFPRIPFFTTSVHSPADVQALTNLPPEVQQKIAFILAGNVFTTPSHPELPARGINFLRAIVHASPFDVLAVGGVDDKNFSKIASAEVKGWAGISAWFPTSDAKRAQSPA